MSSQPSINQSLLGGGGDSSHYDLVIADDEFSCILFAVPGQPTGAKRRSSSLKSLRIAVRADTRMYLHDRSHLLCASTHVSDKFTVDPPAGF